MNFKVMADFSSTGIWDLNTGVMVDYDQSGLPDELINELHQWVLDYARKYTDKETFRVIKEKSEEFNKRGLELAEKVRKVHKDSKIEYWGERTGHLDKYAYIEDRWVRIEDSPFWVQRFRGVLPKYNKIFTKNELLMTVAKILAQRYWDGAHDKHNVKSMSFEEYFGKSVDGWFNTARGVIALIKTMDRK